MKKGITKDQVVETTLKLIKDNENIRSVNLRGVAREIGCAHTNLYNYFSSFDELLWCAHIKILEIFLEELKEKILVTNDYELKLNYFYNHFVDFSLKHKGWFRLAWFEILEGNRPEEDRIATTQTVDAFVEIIEGIWISMYDSSPCREKIRAVIHNVHCYIHGEVSIYIAKRGLIQEEYLFKKYVVNQCIKLTKLLLNEED
ncbi:TetR/AcrR family transcriptional regulator [Clostridium uliginosum]|uniref:DNA-binding transcriptional regulator, AcrR family n=1 Tax=Clostridium uliginosum TaxID=119641 RepID=A0A1I1N6H1_9CLOT|nr:TetR/AcrR family transcriptional regulator [Clostridium uliginosum]SFC93294.1 DNA-binding transcriptional regulator, AcrR family [Clostridium uliginosum]